MQTRATREFALVSLYLYLSLYRPFLGRHVINQPVALCTSAREETHRVCFASSCAHRGHIERKYRAWTTSMTRNASACADARTALPQISHFSRIRFVSIRQSICDQTPPTSSIIDRYSFTRKKKRNKERKYISSIYIYNRHKHKSMKPSFFSPILSLSLVPSLRVENLGRRGRGKKREGKTFHPSFIHVITSISISRRISNSLVPVCTYSRIYAQGYKDVCIRGCGAGCKHKGGEGARGRAT